MFDIHLRLRGTSLFVGSRTSALHRTWFPVRIDTPGEPGLHHTQLTLNFFSVERLLLSCVQETQLYFRRT